MKKNCLLPHVCQRIGAWLGGAWLLMLLAYSIICLRVAFVSERVDAVLSPSSRFTNFSAAVIVAVLCVAVILMAFSRERYEDEMIDEVRKSSLMCVAYVSFFLFVVIPLVCSLCEIAVNASVPSEVWWRDRWSLLDEICKAIKEPLIIFIFYELVFRIRLAKLKKGLNDEE